MEITVIGWYGTETIGDRAILAGIFSILSQVLPFYKIRLGSLYPFFTERTILDDEHFFDAISLHKVSSISLFDSQNPAQLRRSIVDSDLLIVGGGPLMDLREMNMLEYAFLFAKKKHVKTMLFGCGWGPLNNQITINKAIHLVELSDAVVFRDSVSREQCLALCPCYADKICSSIDPAFFACDFFVKNEVESRKRDHVSVNFRDISLEGNHYTNKEISEEVLVHIVSDIASHTQLPVELVPMHSFFLGGDDREILTRIEKKVALSNVSVIQVPLSLYETMSHYYNAILCVGMRFHAVVLQTMLNGNNYVVDYTDPLTGKIIGMLKQMGIDDYYKNRYYSLHADNVLFKVDLFGNDRFRYDSETIQNYFEQYVDCLKGLGL